MRATLLHHNMVEGIMGQKRVWEQVRLNSLLQQIHSHKHKPRLWIAARIHAWSNHLFKVAISTLLHWGFMSPNTWILGDTFKPEQWVSILVNEGCITRDVKAKKKNGSHTSWKGIIYILNAESIMYFYRDLLCLIIFAMYEGFKKSYFNHWRNNFWWFLAIQKFFNSFMGGYTHNIKMFINPKTRWVLNWKCKTACNCNMLSPRRKSHYQSIY